MTTVLNHYWDDQHPLKPYTVSLAANPGSLAPRNASRTVPPTAPEGKHPAWIGGAWGLIEDHRGQTGYVGKEQIEIKDGGPLPAGWSATPPPPTAAEQRELDIAECQAKLDELDRKSTRSLRAIEALRKALETASTDDKPKIEEDLDAEEKFLADLEDKAKAWRAKLDGLNKTVVAE
jgi:hypothetical protein